MLDLSGKNTSDDFVTHYSPIHCFRFHLSSNVNASEVREIGLREVARIKADMEEVLLTILNDGGYYCNLSTKIPRMSTRSIEYISDNAERRVRR